MFCFIFKKILHCLNAFLHLHHIFRGVAQLASVLAWGARGRKFESSHPDEKSDKLSLF